MSTLPHPSAGLIDTLDGIRRRVKTFAVTYGVGLLLSLAAGVLLLTVLLDWTLNLPKPLRLVLILASLATLTYAAMRWIIRPLKSRLTLSDMAGRLENAFPQFDDRLRSTIDFLGQSNPGSGPMKDRVVAQANELASQIKLQEAIIAKPVWHSLLGGFGALLAIALLGYLAGGSFLQTASNRLLLGDAKWPKSVQLDMVNSVPLRVPVGKSVEVKIRDLKGKAKKATILYRYDEQSPWQKELMTAGPDGVYTARLDTKLATDQNAGQLFIKMQAGDDEKILTPVTVVPRLDISRIEAHITPPPYAEAPPVAVDLGERPAVMAVGSGVNLVVTFNKPLAKEKPVSIELVKAEQKAPPIQWTMPAAAIANGAFAGMETIRFVVRATDEDGFQNTGTQEYELIVREDALPTVQIEQPRRSEERTPNAAFPLKVLAEDDYGVSRAQLVIQRMNVDKPVAGAPPVAAQKQQWTIDLVNGAALAESTSWSPAEGSAERRRFRLEHLWSLEKLPEANLKPGDVLEYFVQVKDNFVLSGKEHDWVPSGKLRINIVSKEQMEQRDLGAAEQAHNEISQIKRDVQTNRAETEQLAANSKEAAQFDPADQKQAERLATEQATAAQRTKQTAGKLNELLQRMAENKTSEKGLREAAEQAKNQLETTAEGTLKEANQNLNNAKDKKPDPKASDEQKKKDTADRNAELAKAQDNQQRAAEQLDQAMQKLGEFDGLSQWIDRLDQIRKEQEALGKKFSEAMKDDIGKRPDQLSKEKQDELNKLSDEQKKLSDRTEKAIEDMQKQGDQKPKNDPSAQAMKDAAKTGQQQQVASKQEQAAEKMKQNQQAGAQQQQQQVQIGIEMMLKQLKDAERRKLEELEKKLSDIEKLVADLVRRQAGHNIDNLTLDDAKKLAAMTEEARTELMNQAERDPANQPAPPTLTQLSTSQEQTERNARDVAKTAEALPDPAPAAKLTAAAGQMERAIVHLRANELPKAYEPPQVEALRSLAEAKEKIDKALAEARKELKQQDQETIKAAYVKLLDAQKKLDKETVDIDAVPADKRPRDVTVRLGQLPAAQGELAAKAEALGKELEKIGSIVYVWANKDITKTMGEVKEDLAKPETGKPVQAEQLRIEEQLVAMIDSLKEDPKKSKFDQPKGGGAPAGGGKPKVKMPSEVELRLTKELQKAINKSTKTVDAEAQKDEKKLLALGGRQGEIRGLLDQLVRASSEGKLKFAEEPENKDQLPDEAKEEDIENQEFEKGLLQGDLVDDTVVSNVKLTGDRMARARQRLQLNNDPGKTTQKIQDRIIEDLDLMIELARRQEPDPSKSPPGGQPQPGQKKPGSKPGEGEKGQQATGEKEKGMSPGSASDGGTQAAADSSLNPGDRKEADLSREIKERMQEWGGLTQRERDAVIEGASEKTIQKYERLVEDYYRELAKKATQK